MPKPPKREVNNSAAYLFNFLLLHGELQSATYFKKKTIDFTKKPNLEIDVNTVNEEPGEGNVGMNLDLSQMRLALGSEQLVRQQSARTLSQSLGTPT